MVKRGCGEEERKKKQVALDRNKDTRHILETQGKCRHKGTAGQPEEKLTEVNRKKQQGEKPTPCQKARWRVGESN